MKSICVCKGADWGGRWEIGDISEGKVKVGGGLVSGHLMPIL